MRRLAKPQELARLCSTDHTCNLTTGQAIRNMAAPAPAPPAAAAAPPHPLIRIRLMTDATGARIPYTPAELYTFLRNDLIRNNIFQGLSIADALSLTDAYTLRDQAGQRLTLKDYTMCDLTCQDPQMQVPIFGSRGGGVPAFVLDAPAFELPGWVSIPCPRIATWDNIALNVPAIPGGHNELSMCREPHNAPVAGTHARPNPCNPLVCQPCRTWRTADWVKRRRTLWLGVCGECRTWATNNTPAANRNRDCGCDPPFLWRRELCRAHDQAYWAITAAVAQTEINRRRRMRKKKKAAKSPYVTPQTRQRRAAAAPTLQQASPAARRNTVKWNSKSGMDAVPRCFCGNTMTAADHARPGPPAPGVGPNWQVRNCVGCNEFLWTNL